METKNNVCLLPHKFHCYIDGEYVRSFVNADVAMWWCKEMREKGLKANYEAVRSLN